MENSMESSFKSEAFESRTKSFGFSCSTYCFIEKTMVKETGESRKLI